MPKLKLDAVNALNAQCEPGRKKTDYWDTVITGLTLECRSTGGRTFYLRYQDKHGRQRQHKIAAYGDLSVAEVRKEAQRLRSEVVLGGDPAAEKEVTKAIPTYAELSALHLAQAKTHQRSYDTTEMYMRRHILPRWGKEMVSDITQPKVALWLAEKSKEGLALATVEKIRVIMGRSFELAIQWNTPGVTRNPTRGIKRPPINNARERFLNELEAERLRVAVAKSRNRQLPAIVGLLLLTGARLMEILSAEWANIDRERNSLLVPMSKSGKARRIPLSKMAMEVVDQIKRKANSPYLFPSRFDPKRHITSIKNSWQTARSEAKLNDLHLHDLRHSFASFAIGAGVDLFAVGKILGHADYKSTMRYSHLQNTALLAAVEAGSTSLKTGWTHD